jgi:uncharacterized integral membrane protein
MASLSTPINQIRSQSSNSLPPPTNTFSQNNMQLQQPMYNPVVNISPDMQHQDTSHLMPQQNMGGNQLVDDLLNELEAQPEYQQDINVAHSQYAMDGINTPPTRTEQDKYILSPESTQSVSVDNNPHLLSNKSRYGNDEYNYNGSSSSRFNTKNIITMVKPGLIIFVLFVVFSLHQVNRVIFSFLPNLLLENGQLSLYAILLKAVVVTALYYLFDMLF